MSTWVIERDDTRESINLKRGLYWLDEMDWTPLAMSPPVYTVDGSVIYQQGVKKAGQLITLDGSKSGWQYRKTVKLLKEWQKEPELTFKLTHPDGRSYNVIFANHQKAVDAVPNKKYDKPSDTDFYRVKLFFITV